MPFVEISPDCRIEVFYFNDDQCVNYNSFYSLRKVLTPGYYYEDMNGPFKTKQEAIHDAKVHILEE